MTQLPQDDPEQETGGARSRVGWHIASAAAVVLWILLMIATSGDLVGATVVAVAVLVVYGGLRLLKS